MNIQKLTALVAAIDLGSFSRAAEKLGYTQSGLTHMMNSLEEEVGFPLIRRGNFGIRPTEAGERLLPRIRALLSLEGELCDDVRRLREEGRCLRVGVIASLAVHWLPAILAGLADPRVEITEGTAAELYEGLESGRLDLALVNRRGGGTCDFIPLVEEPLLAVLPSDHPHAGAPLRLSALEGLPFFLSGLSAAGEIADLLSSHGITPQASAVRLDDAAILSMVGHGHGLSLLPALAVRGHSTAVTCLVTEPPLHRTLGVALAGGKKPTEAARRLIAAARRVAEGLETEE